MRSLTRIFDFHAPLPWRLADGVEDALDLRVERVAEGLASRISRPGSMSAAFCFDGQAGVGVHVAQNPALALGDGLGAELLRRDLVAPLAEGALGELLDVALVDQRDGLAACFEGGADGVADQALGAEDGDGLDAHAGVGAHFLLAVLGEQVVVEEIDQPGGVRASPP